MDIANSEPTANSGHGACTDAFFFAFREDGRGFAAEREICAGWSRLVEVGARFFFVLGQANSEPTANSGHGACTGDFFASARMDGVLLLRAKFAQVGRV